MLVVHPAFYLFYYILPKDPPRLVPVQQIGEQSLSCELVCNFISMHTRMSKDPKQSQNVWCNCHSIPFGTVVCTNGDVVLAASTVRMNFMHTDQGGIYLGLENSSIFS